MERKKQQLQMYIHIYHFIIFNLESNFYKHFRLYALSMGKHGQNYQLVGFFILTFVHRRKIEAEK